MTSKEQGRQYAARRAQAQRNMKTHITEILSAAASDIADKASVIKQVSNKTLFTQLIASMASDVLKEADEKIMEYTIAYSKASIQVLGDKDTGATTRLINSNLFGKTFLERNETYMGYFCNDLANLIFACKKLKITGKQMTGVILKSFQDPYSSDIIARANKKGAGIQTPSYGHGIYHSAYQNIVRNAQGVISVAWGRELRNYAKRNGAIGFYVYRGSSYPCDICDSEVDQGLHPITDDMPPFHCNCVCIVELVYKED